MTKNLTSFELIEIEYTLKKDKYKLQVSKPMLAVLFCFIQGG